METIEVIICLRVDAVHEAAYSAGLPLSGDESPPRPPEEVGWLLPLQAISLH
jgi:hypothetical protein